MVKKFKALFAFILILMLSGMTAVENKSEVESAVFKKYWFSGKAEISSYELSQSRYGEIHNGKAVLIFVTEPFSKQKKVKVDNSNAKSYDVLKCNFTKKFNTGIYPYSMMFSSFLPLNDPSAHLDKLSMSGQEWCGQVFMQVHADNQKWKGSSFSYFESEGDQEISMQKSLLEDEIWSKIKTDPSRLPVGKTEMVPSTFYCRLMHKSFKGYAVVASLKDDDKKLYRYHLNYPALSRTLTISFEKQFPHKIISWEETYPSFSGELLSTKANLKKTIQLPYWEKHSVRDSVYRNILGLNK